MFNCRELISIQFALNLLGLSLSGSRVKWFTYCQGALRIIQVGSIHFKLNNLASSIFSFCSNNEMYKEVKLQYLGNVVDPDDWEFVPEILYLLDVR